MATIVVIRELIKYLREGRLITKHCVMMDTVLAEYKIVNKKTMSIR